MEEQINKSETPVSADAPSYYVGIGASAGGLEALQILFENMPTNSGAAFIVVQHLSPDFKSAMVELLGRHTDMPVHHATDGVEVLKENIYLIPPKKNLMIAEGRLLLNDVVPDSGLNLPIDSFLRSLAEDQHHRSIAVILSGTGSDGSQGLRPIKEVGGLILVQEPSNAKFDGMPYNAVNTGLADLVCPVDKIPEKIVNYVRNQVISVVDDDDDSDGTDETQTALKDIFRLLQQRSEIDFSKYKTSTVMRRMERRMGINQIRTIKEYYQYMLSNPKELQILSKDLLIGVTRFFRDTEAFNVLENEIIPKLLDSVPADEPIRVWIASCSTGEEAYSVGILFAEAMRKRDTKRNVKIFATDVDPDAINEAGVGQFPTNIVSDIDESILKRYFRIEKGKYVIHQHIRQMVIFAVQNLIKDPPFSNINLASCRNALIYFQPPVQKQVLSLLHFSLQQDGYLFLGSSESLGELSRYFEVINERFRFFKKKLGANAFLANKPARPEIKGFAPNVKSLMRKYKGVTANSSTSKLTSKLLDQYVPPCIILNSQREILHIYGDVSKYMRIRSGRFSANIKDMVSDDLSVALSTALNRSERSHEDVLYSNVSIQLDDTQQMLNLRIRFFEDDEISDTVYMVMFEDLRPAVETEQLEAIEYDVASESRQRIRDLEHELHKKQERLQVTVEELESTNEELQSSNEELLAANEELQSTNEELQSVNEELYTVNSEYQEKITELTHLNTDLDNIMKSIDTGIIFLDDMMMIRNYTPAVSRYVHLLSTDVGRPIHHISHTLKYHNLLKDLSDVIEHRKAVEREILTTKGESLIIRISPYYKDKQETEGCVITITDISNFRNLEKALQASYQELRATINQSVVTAKDQKLSILLAENSEEDLFTMRRQLSKVSSAYEITEARNATEAASALEKQAFDICLVDYKLESETAFDLLRSLPESDNVRETAFILLTGVFNSDINAEALDLGIYDCVEKSELSPALLDRVIRYTMRHKKTEQYLVGQSNKERMPSENHQQEKAAS